MNVNEKDAIRLNEIEFKIISTCCGRPRGVKDMAEMLSIGYSSGEMKRAISRLLQLKLIEFTIPEYYRSYSQRYKTTQKGREYLLKNDASKA